MIFTSTLALLALGIGPIAAGATNYDDDQTESVAATAGPGACMPVTKAYPIKQGFCPMTLVHMIPRAVGPDCCCGGGCGPYGIPPIYAAGQNVMVRQTPEMQERVKEFLTSLGALVERKPRSY
jgi:hypothetical protein